MKCFAALDIGSTKIACMIGCHEEGSLRVLGKGVAPALGMRKGTIVHIDATVQGIQQAVREAEKAAGVSVDTVIAGISGSHIQSFNSTGIVAIRDKEVVYDDVRRVLEAARAVAIPVDRETIHMLPQEYLINDQGGIRDPLGMSGVRLEAKVHIVTGSTAVAQNIIKCANKAGLHVAEVCLASLASAQSLCHDEKELGVVLIDIGGSTTDIVIFKEGAIIHTAIIPIGGSHITNDIALGLRTPIAEAEKMKCLHGCALTSLIGFDEMVEVPGVGGRRAQALSRRSLADIIEPRLEELILMVGREIDKTHMRHVLSAGIVMTGGSSLVYALPELAEFTLEMPVKRVDASPELSTVLGLLRTRYDREQKKVHQKNTVSDRLTRSVSAWMRDLF